MSTIIHFLCRGVIYKNGDFTWRVSDCEELVGGYSQGLKFVTKVNGKDVLWSIYTLRFTFTVKIE